MFALLLSDQKTTSSSRAGCCLPGGARVVEETSVMETSVPNPLEKPEGAGKGQRSAMLWIQFDYTVIDFPSCWEVPGGFAIHFLFI